MTYKISLHGWGSECVAGKIPDNVWKYIQDECDGDVETYKDKLDEDEVPEEFKIAEDESMFYDAVSFYRAYGPYDSCSVTVLDENDEEVAELDASDLKNETTYASASKADGKPYFVWESVEKGRWQTEIETDEPFDKDKLKLSVTKLSYNNYGASISHITAVEYDGIENEVEVDSTEGKSYELDFYKEDDKEED